MKMIVTKNNGKPHVISYQRDNGSITWMHADDYFVRHDLSHYALEKTMEYTTAFMGMLNKGMDVKDFEDREKRLQIPMTDEAYAAENMANLFLVELAQGNFDDFNTVAGAAFESMKAPFEFQPLPGDKIETIRRQLKQLLSEWRTLAAGQTLSLTIDL